MIENVYVSLIIKGNKSLGDVPLHLQEKVKELLIKINREDLTK